MQYGTTELREVQRVQMSMLREIVRICDENEIQYFVLGGTLLGAIRHHGFIPWDDDVDVAMPRDDYNRFINLAKHQLRDDLFLQTYDTDNESPFYFAKVRKTGTRFVEYYCRDLEINQGIFVDIFPFDNVPQTAFRRKIHFMHVSLWSNLFISKCVREPSTEPHDFIGFIKSYMRRVLHFFLKPVSKNLLYRLLDFQVQRYNSVETSLMCFVPASWCMIDASSLYPLKKEPFEDLMVSMPHDAVGYLTSHYGDFMKLPPQEKRYGHKPYIVEV